MDRECAKSTLSAHMQEFRNVGVKTLALFGSVARGDSSDSSDVDLLVEFDRPIGLFAFFNLQHRLESLLGVERVDLVMPNALKPALRSHILSEAINVP